VSVEAIAAATFSHRDRAAELQGSRTPPGGGPGDTAPAEGVCLKRDPDFYPPRFLDGSRFPVVGFFSAYLIIAVPTVIALLFIVDHMLVENDWS